MSIRILIVEDHPITRLGLRVVLEGHENFVVVGEAGDGLDAIKQVEKLKPDLVVMDLGLPVVDGFECALKLKSGRIPVRIIIHSSHDEESYIKRALKIGVDGYCLKDSSDNNLIAAVNKVMAGEAWFDPRVPTHLQQHHYLNLKGF